MKKILTLWMAAALLCGGCGQEYATHATRKKAERGDAEAQYRLGKMYDIGQGVTKDHEEAAKWFRKAAVQGLARAQWELGRMYYFGTGVPKDEVEAAKWYRKAAEQGDNSAQYFLGVMYAEGESMPKKVAELYRRLQGFQPAIALGEGVPKNDAEAYAWFLLAKANGHPSASEGISILEKRLTPEQIEKGRARAAELLKKIGKK